MHNVQHICELPPLYEVERGLGGEYKKANMKRCDVRLAFKRRACPALAGGNVSDICSILYILFFTKLSHYFTIFNSLS